MPFVHVIDDVRYCYYVYTDVYITLTSTRRLHYYVVVDNYITINFHCKTLIENSRIPC